MKIYNINSINFSASRKTNNLHSAMVQNSRDEFYTNINGFLNKDYDKKEYLKLFSENVNKIKTNKEANLFSSTEKKYINDLLMTMDLADKLERISDKYLTESMTTLLKTKK